MPTRSLKTLRKGDLKKLLKAHPNWTANTKGTQLACTFRFSNQIDALAFIARIVVHAQVMSHYPEITLTLGKVKVMLTTTEVKGLSAYDAELLARIDGLRLVDKKR